MKKNFRFNKITDRVENYFYDVFFYFLCMLIISNQIIALIFFK